MLHATNNLCVSILGQSV